MLLEEIAGADRVVLLGDVVELRDLALGVALDSARPFFEELGAALGEREVTIVPGNHDHRLAEPLLDRLSLAGAAELGLEQHDDAPGAGAGATIDAWLGPASLRIAYPGLWLREDVYATHGHYMDAHLNLPRAECLAVATLIRLSGPLPSPATPADYERVLRPHLRLQLRRRPGAGAGSAAPGPTLRSRLEGAGRRQRRGQLAPAPARRHGARRLPARHPRDQPPAARGLRQPTSPPTAIFLAGVEAAAELATRLGVDGTHLITGHTHRGGPNAGEATWPLAGGGHLHNTGSWVFATAFHNPGTPPSPYWPGTVTWVEDTGPPRREQLLLDRSHPEMLELIERTRGSSPTTRR